MASTSQNHVLEVYRINTLTSLSRRAGPVNLIRDCSSLGDCDWQGTLGEANDCLPSHVQKHGALRVLLM